MGRPAEPSVLVRGAAPARGATPPPSPPSPRRPAPPSRRPRRVLRAAARSAGAPSAPPVAEAASCPPPPCASRRQSRPPAGARSPWPWWPSARLGFRACAAETLSPVAQQARRFLREGRLGVSAEQFAELSGHAGLGPADDTLFGFSVRELSAQDPAARVRAAERLKALAQPSAAPALATALHAETDAHRAGGADSGLRRAVQGRGRPRHLPAARLARGRGAHRRAQGAARPRRRATPRPTSPSP